MSSFNIKPIILVSLILPAYMIGMFIGLFGYSKLSGELLSKFYVWGTENKKIKGDKNGSIRGL